MSVRNFALNEETSLNKKLASSLHRRPWNAFFFFNFVLYPMKTKRFVCCANGSFMWSDSLFFCHRFFKVKKKIPEEEKQQKQNMEG